MQEFFRFPHTPHLTWLGQGTPRGDKVLSPSEVQELLAVEVVVEEKLDGANLGLLLAHDGSLRLQNRGQYLVEPHTGQFDRLSAWLTQHEEALHLVLRPGIILFGEWCAARHSLGYTALPDWFLLFDVYDQAACRFWSTNRRNALASSARLVTVPELVRGRTTVTALTQLVATASSHYRKGELEGVMIRRETKQWLEVLIPGSIRPPFRE